MRNNIILTGFSGTGKSDVGYIVSQIMNWTFLDTDQEIEKRASMAIPDIFEKRGEAEFRRLEKSVIAETLKFSESVISTGGGAIIDEENLYNMRKTGFIICLEAKAETINTRISHQLNDKTSSRPLLAQGATHQNIPQLKSQRQYKYSMADWTIHTDNLTPLEVAREVVRAWEINRDSSEY